MALIAVVDNSLELARDTANLISRFDDSVKWLPSIEKLQTSLAALKPDLVMVRLHFGQDAALEGLLGLVHVPVIAVGERCPVERLAALYRTGIAYYITLPFHPRELVSLIYAKLHGQKQVVCIGGGSGLYTLLIGLKHLPHVHLTSIVAMSDDGGSSGRIREAFGILPPGDIRRSLVALSSAPELLKDLMQYRFNTGEGLRDHNLGNLLMTAMVGLTGDDAEAVRAMGDILSIEGIVLPVATAKNALMAEMADGTVVEGEQNIDMPNDRDPSMRIVRLWQDPACQANPDALAAILAADMITLGPGDLYTSVIAALLPQGIGEAIRASRGKVMYISNVMTKPGETSGYSAADHIAEVVRYLGEDVLHTVLLSNTRPQPQAIEHYAAQDQRPVVIDEPHVLSKASKAHMRLAGIGYGDDLVRHDPVKLRLVLAGILGIEHLPDAPV